MNRKAKRAKFKLPCKCGSGIRYDKCHYPKELAVQGAVKIFRDKEEKRHQFQHEHGHIRKPQIVEIDGKHLVCVGNQIFMQKEAVPYNFVNAIHDYALHFIGDGFLDSEESKAYEDRHPAIQWLHAYTDHHNRVLAQADASPQDFQHGFGAAWTRFAYDIYTIRDNADLQETMRGRLLKVRDFQSARHELFVAALFVAAGFDIGFEDEADNTKKHPEFIATDKITGMKVAVEAKSRQWSGVKGFIGGKEFSENNKLNLRRLIAQAYQKSRDIPLYIFVDVNLPSVSEDIENRWVAEINETMNDLANEGYYNPCPAHAVFFHNDPSHYIDGLINRDRDHLWIRYFEDFNYDKPCPENIVDRILTAHNQRAVPPQDIPEF